MSTNAQLTQQITELLAAWNEREAQFRAWLAGTPTGGPNSDGRYPLTNAARVTVLVDSPAKLASTVEGPAGLSVAARLLSEAARDIAIGARDRAITAEATAITMNAQTLSHRNLALTYRNEAAAFAAGLSAAQTAAIAAKVAAEVAQGQATQKAIDAASSEANAAASASAAATSAAAAATFDPNNFYTKTAADARYKPIAYVPSWAEITGTPSTFAPSAHSHVIADVTGLQTALDGKQAAGSYAAAVHGHVIGDITGLQAALDGKQASLGYTPANRAGDTFLGNVASQVGTSAVVLVASDGSIEITRAAGAAYIDFKNLTAEDFDLRLQESGGLLNVSGGIRTNILYDIDDTSFYVNPNGESRLNTFKVLGETYGPGSINGDWEGGYYHFTDTQNTPTGGFGHAHIIRLAADWNVQMFFPTSNSNEPMWIRQKQNGTYSAWRRMLQEDEWIGSKYFASDGRIYGTIFYDSNDGAYYCDPAGTSVLNTAQFNGTIGVGQAVNPTWRIITSGTNAIYLNGGGYGQAEGSWRAPVFYDSDDTGYFLNPNGTSNLNNLTMAGLVTGRSSASTDVNTANDLGSFSVRGSSTTVAAMSFHRTATYAINMGLGTDNVFRIGGWSASNNAFQMDGGGNLTMLGNVTAYSDARLKKDVETIGGALDIVQQLRGVRYTRIDSGQRQVGVIAQETQKVVPEVVQQGIGDDDTLSVAYGNLVGVLIEAIKELRVEVETLKGNNE